ncbi:MAG: cyclase family protein [Candidatus Promineifilaceae bacterium]
MTKLIDISRRLTASLAPWPGDSPFRRDIILTLANGDAVNLSTISVSSHFGTHVDAPFHFVEDGKRMDEVDLRPYWGKAQVVTVTKGDGPLTPEDFSHVNPALAPRILVRTPLQSVPHDTFPDAIPHPSPALADWLGQHGIILYGTDAPSMDALDSKDLPGHHALHRNSILILEGLDLSAAPDGLYELAALPLKIGGGDGSPVRAVLRTIEG